MSTVNIRKRFELRAHDTWTLGHRVETLRRVIESRNGIVLAVSWSLPDGTGAQSAIVHYQLPVERSDGPTHLAG